MKTRKSVTRVIVPSLATLLALLILLAASAAYAFLPNAPFKAPMSFGIAALKSLLIVAFFMRLLRASSLTRAAAFIAPLWLAIFLALAWADYSFRL
jgi:cytochrome c oxidase subunit 4